MRWMLLSVVSFVFLVGCEADEGFVLGETEDAYDDVGGLNPPTGGPGTAPDKPVPIPDVKSGSRLVHRYFEAEDGAVIRDYPGRMSDRYLGVDCVLGQGADGKHRCYPHYDETLNFSALLYADGACKIPLLTESMIDGLLCSDKNIVQI